MVKHLLHRPLSRIVVVCLLTLVFGSVGHRVVFAQTNQTVDINVGGTLLTVDGRTFPNAFVTVMDDTSVIGTLTADSNGDFYKTYPAQTPGLHTIRVFAGNGTFATDTDSRTLNFASQTETKFNVLLPPIFNMERSGEEPNELITFSGLTAPNTTVNVYLDSGLLFQTLTDPLGTWEIALNTLDITHGQHSVYAVGTDGVGGQSIATTSRTFDIDRPPVTAEEPDSDAPIKSSSSFARIDSPASGLRTSNGELLLSGTASPEAQIELWDNNTPVGSVFAGHLGKWSLNYLLSKPTHNLKVRACVDSVCGPFSEIITVYYTAVQTGQIPDLQLQDYLFHGIKVGGSISLHMNIVGGTQPYTLFINWGDGQSDTLMFDGAGFHNATHTYESIGKYNATVELVDKSGYRVRRHFSVEVIGSLGLQLNLMWLVPLLATIILAARLLLIPLFFPKNL